MMLQIEFWQLLSMLFSLAGVAFAAGKVLLVQMDRRLEQRFSALDSAREVSSRHWDDKFTGLLEQIRRETEGWKTLEREFLRFQADLPIQYVRREDYVRNQMVIEAKLDTLAMKIENLQLMRTDRPAA
ncbi:HPt (histidine-containing phosphotransfer) domain-containing protein [Chitinivorax tropicus]|uniref:HPt (Histidine-containing phosphotransfer) domain-containing protein n=1 Tax=Chitinivorax tropicus TaxID=714531 RepID=A0A840ML26_9PROT|nr:hypothetical protein [Chitinivorax tropicus]MBB5017412.1 HPt (histidine-containing phosphotransfer) domain-containing protein [Chitinivorax tropicus]